MEKNHAQWMHGKFTDINAENLDKEVNDYYRKLSKAEKVLSKNKVEECADIARKLKAEVDDFRIFGPLVIALRSPGMRKRHWSELSLKVNKVVEPDENFTLTTVIDLGLTEHIELVKKIGETADKEYQIEKALDSMENEWNGVNLVIEPYRNTGTSIMKGADELITMLDEQITMTQAMSFSSFKKPFEERIAAWDKRLSTVSEVIDEWLAVQRSWLYLQPIFDSDDIKKQLPTESKRFLTVDKNWRQTLSAAAKHPKQSLFVTAVNCLKNLKKAPNF
jgi:dynein heavy chain